jgi:ElaB/YqjD/DUF883 family membrane-anchored ribosome-binding protein
LPLLRVLDGAELVVADLKQGAYISPNTTFSGRRLPMATSREAEAKALANQIDAIRADMQNLTSTVSRIANAQVNRAQGKAMETAQEAGDAIKRNPLQAVAIAAGLGFLFGVFARR